MMHRLCRGIQLSLAGLLLASIANFGQAQTASRYQLGVVGKFIQGQGYNVDQVVAGSAANRIVAQDDGATYRLEKDDIIVAVDGEMLTSAGSLIRQLNESRHRHGRSWISVLDKATGTERSFLAQLTKQNYSNSYSLGVIPKGTGKQGILVDTVTPGGPATKMWNQQFSTAWIDPDDEILSVNDFQTHDVDSLRAAIQTTAANDGVGTITIANHQKNGAIEQYNFRANAVGSRKIHYLVIGQSNTGHKSFDGMVSKSLADLDSTFRHIGHDMLGSARFVTGRQCTANHIKAALKDMHPKQNDAVIVYILAHGAYDQKGHFFQLEATQAEPSDTSAGKNMYRQEISKILAEMNVRLSVFISESCHSFGQFQRPDYRPAASTGATIGGLTPLEDLLLNYSGTIEINAAARDQFGWASSVYGGMYSYNFSKKLTSTGLNPEDGWRNILETVGQSTNLLYQNIRAAAVSSGNAPQAMVDQKQLTPTTFQFQISKDDSGIKPPRRKFRDMERVE
jgi:hypothetical protein